jgi:hypothetical protein
MHAVVIRVEIESARWAEAQTVLHESVVPMTKAVPGFVRGTWMHNQDTSTGTGVIVFETPEHAKAMLSEMEQSPPSADDPVTITSVEIFEIAAEA